MLEPPTFEAESHWYQLWTVSLVREWPIIFQGVNTGGRQCNATVLYMRGDRCRCCAPLCSAIRTRMYLLHQFVLGFRCGAFKLYFWLWLPQPELWGVCRTVRGKLPHMNQVRINWIVLCSIYSILIYQLSPCKNAKYREVYSVPYRTITSRHTDHTYWTYLEILHIYRDSRMDGCLCSLLHNHEDSTSSTGSWITMACGPMKTSQLTPQQLSNARLNIYSKYGSRSGKKKNIKVKNKRRGQ